ncbi:MAG: S53 family peptidase [Candidatus Limnocylindrales bacterium]|jgi:hypothetical protein
MTAPLILPATSIAKSTPVPDPNVEAVCPPATPGTAECLALRRTDKAAHPATAASPHTPPPGLGPADIQDAYALPSGSAGTGMTVAIVDAYDLPTAEADLGVYRSLYGLPPCTTANGCFRKVNQTGGSSYPVANSGWGLEIALDLQMASAACPNCKILLVEATTASFGNLGQAVNTAVSLGAVAVSNSYGGPEDPTETSVDTYYNHPGVAITVATGDCGYNCNTGPSGGVEYPSSSQYVVAVGGTTLTKDSSARGWTETAWGHNTAGAGSGCSLYEPKPSWQHDSGCLKRTVADVSAVADPATGVAVYDSDPSVGGWGVYGGTSAATPIIAAVYALAGQPAAGTYPASYSYAAPANLYDVVGGNNNVTGQTCTVTYFCNGVAGYDGPTGLGTPNGVGAFVAPAGLTVSGFPSSTAPGIAHSLTVTATTASSGTATDYRGTVHFTSSDPAAVLPADYTFTASDAGVHAFDVTLSSFGTQSVTATDTISPSTTGSQTGIFVTWPASTYTAISPRRILDTRPTIPSGNPTNIGLSGKFTAGTVRRFAVAGARYVGGGTAPAIPANAVAITGNLTIVYETAPGVIDLGPAVTAGGATSSLNFVPGDTRANNVTLGLATDGYLSAVYRSSTAGATTDLIFDLTGYFTPGAGGATYHPVVTPGRVLDTRPTYGGNTHIGPFTKLPNRVVKSFPVVGVTGLGWSSPQVPSGAVAVTGNVTVTNATSLGYVALGPTMSAWPSTSTANVAAWTNVANGVTVALSGGSLQIVWCGTIGSSADVIFDVTGYFTAGAGGLSYYPVFPVRVMDSSKNLGITGPFPSRIAQLFTLPGVPAGAAAISGNLTLLTPTSNGWALITPEIVASPMTSTVNASAGHSEANGFDVAIGTSNHVALEWAGTVGSTANLSLDITGFWK